MFELHRWVSWQTFCEFTVTETKHYTFTIRLLEEPACRTSEGSEARTTLTGPPQVQEMKFAISCQPHAQLYLRNGFLCRCFCKTTSNTAAWADINRIFVAELSRPMFRAAAMIPWAFHCTLLCSTLLWKFDNSATFFPLRCGTCRVTLSDNQVAAGLQIRFIIIRLGRGRLIMLE